MVLVASCGYPFALGGWCGQGVVAAVAVDAGFVGIFVRLCCEISAFAVEILGCCTWVKVHGPNTTIIKLSAVYKNFDVFGQDPPVLQFIAKIQWLFVKILNEKFIIDAIVGKA